MNVADLAIANPPRPTSPAFMDAGQTVALYRGEALALLAAVPDDTVDAVITDPPYSSGGFTRGDRMQKTADKYVEDKTIKQRPDFSGDNRDNRGWLHWSALWLAECHRVTKPAGYCLTFTDWRQLPQATDALQAGGYVWRGLIVWDKTECARPPHTGYFRHQAEYIVWGSKGISRPATWGGPWPGVYRLPVLQSDKHHMTGKPTDLLRALVQCVPPGGLVLDPFAGSGTTLAAAYLENRHAIGFELHDPVVAGAVRRLDTVTAQGNLWPMEATTEGT